MTLPLTSLSPGWNVVLDSAAWAGASVVVGWMANRVPSGRLAHDGWLTRPRSFERDGRFYEALRIRSWKDRLPEAGNTFAGGFSKRRVVDRSDEHLRRFVVETRRGEGVHWTLLALSPVFVLFNPPWLAAAMVAFGLAFNLPFIAIQRYNRARLRRVLARREARAVPAR